MLRFLQISTNATVTLASTMERVLISQTALTAAAQTDLLATDVKQVRGNCMQFAMNFMSKGIKVYLCFSVTIKNRASVVKFRIPSYFAHIISIVEFFQK